MTIFYDPMPQFALADGRVNAGGSVEFFKSGTSDPLDTFNDSLLENKNPNPLILDGAGRLPRCYTDGSSAKIIVRDAGGVLQGERDPVGGESVAGELSSWNPKVVYVKGSLAKGSDGVYYISLVDSNVNNDPTSPSPAFWSEIRFLGVYNADEDYQIGDVIQTIDGYLWASQVSPNIGNNPTIDSGVNWLPAISLNVNAFEPTLTADFEASKSKQYQVEAALAVDITFPGFADGDTFTIHNSSASTAKVQILNPAFSIRGPAGIITAGTNMELAPGNTASLVARSNTILEVY